ncbi:MAG: (2Fe-2S)-binding protein [Candidatus Heimdallarchaeota archaeon]|nr:(2Fe-2S)-binding protein [Candidatus Heimdallarchaeota archaeon]
MKLVTTINGERKSFEVEPNTLLMDFLRHHGYYGVKNGCAEGTCGSCTVLIDNKPMKSCILFVGQVQNKSITTIEGLGTPEHPHPLQDEFVEFGAVQCGYCIPGMILSAHALLLKNPDPSEEEIKRGLDGNLCRCTGYVKQIDAVKAAAKRIKEEN